MRAILGVVSSAHVTFLLDLVVGPYWFSELSGCFLLYLVVVIWEGLLHLFSLFLLK